MKVGSRTFHLLVPGTTKHQPGYSAVHQQLCLRVILAGVDNTALAMFPRLESAIGFDGSASRNLIAGCKSEWQPSYRNSIRNEDFGTARASLRFMVFRHIRWLVRG